jgi:hypothetical protein
MPLLPPLVLEARSGTKFQLLSFFNIVGPFLGLTRNLGAHKKWTPYLIWVKVLKCKGLDDMSKNYYINMKTIINYSNFFS